jgi:putative PIN family toxin of toxin-antitoxin system
MRVVADTNVVVSGLLWRGSPRRILNAARAGTLELFTSPELLGELWDVLTRAKFASRLRQGGVSPDELVLGYAALARLVEPAAIELVVQADPDDDEVLSCAIAAKADFIVSGDSHLVGLVEYQGIPILRAARLLIQLQT